MPHIRAEPPPTRLPEILPISSESKIPTLDNRHMIESQHISSRKRQRSELLQLNETAPPSKRQRLGPRRGAQPPREFWDRLSKVWFTEQALKELDRRNTQAARSALCSLHRRARPSVTRNLLIGSQRNCQTARDTTDYLRDCEPRILKDIRLFARQGGPDLSDLRNYPEPVHPSDRTMSSSLSRSRSRRRGSATMSSTRPTTTTKKTKSTGVYDPNFQQHIIDHGVYPNAYEYPDGTLSAAPSNLGDFKQILAQPRPSLSPSQFSDGEFQRFQRKDANAAKEKQVSESVIPFIEGKIGDEKCRSGGIPFTHLSPLTDGTLKPGNPDVYYGARPEQLSRKIRAELGGQIIPSTQHDLPLAPNFFLEVKGPDGLAAVAQRQACYDGALGARGMQSLQAYGQEESIYHNNASTITSTYYSGMLKMYTTHVAQPKDPGGRPEYHMTQINSWAMTGNADTFRQGARAYRNARDWAKQQRDEAINRANERANIEAETTPSGDTGASSTFSFMTAATETEAYTMSQESFNSGSNVPGDYDDEHESSIEDPVDYVLPAKRLGKQSQRHQPSQRKQRDADVSAKRGRR